MNECINKQYSYQSMGEIEDLVGCTIKRDLANMTLNISQPYIIHKMNQGFNG